MTKITDADRERAKVCQSENMMRVTNYSPDGNGLEPILDLLARHFSAHRESVVRGVIASIAQMQDSLHGAEYDAVQHVRQQLEAELE